MTTKHLAGLVCYTAITGVASCDEHDIDLAFDADPTKVDWGLVNLMGSSRNRVGKLFHFSVLSLEWLSDGYAW